MKKKFTIECEMEERWISNFLSMLNYMQRLGNWGSSRNVTLYADGDGDFRPKFESDIEYKLESPVENNNGHVTYDAG